MLTTGVYGNKSWWHEFRLAAYKCTTGGLVPGVCMPLGPAPGSSCICTHAVSEAWFVELAVSIDLWLRQELRRTWRDLVVSAMWIPVRFKLVKFAGAFGGCSGCLFFFFLYSRSLGTVITPTEWLILVNPCSSCLQPPYSSQLCWALGKV